MNTCITLILHNGKEIAVDISALNLNNPAKIGIRTELVRFCLMTPEVKYFRYRGAYITFAELQQMKQL